MRSSKKEKLNWKSEWLEGEQKKKAPERNLWNDGAILIGERDWEEKGE